MPRKKQLVELYLHMSTLSIFVKRRENAMDPDNDCPIYYRLIVHTTGHRAVIVPMHDFDEYHYDHKRYITSRTFKTEEDALSFCKKIVSNPDVPEHIRQLIQALLEQSVNVDDYFKEEEE